MNHRYLKSQREAKIVLENMRKLVNELFKLPQETSLCDNLLPQCAKDELQIYQSNVSSW